MEGPSRSAGMRKSRRSRSQRDRELRRRRRVNLAEERATSLSSGSDREGRGTNNVLGPGGRERRPVFGRHRPPRRRKRESVSCEEDIIDGFAIASFISLEALEMDCSLKPNQRTDMLGRQNKRKRGTEQNGGGPLSEPEEGAPHSYSSSYLKRRSKRRKMEGSHLETGYICDTESDTGDKASDNEMDPVFTVSTRKAVDPSPSNLATAGKSCPPLSARCGGISRLMVTPRVSGLERSQETSLEPHFPEPFSSSTSPGLICMSSPVTASVAVPRPSPVNGNGTRHNGSPPLSKPKPYGLPPRSQSIYNSSSAPVKTPSSASSVATSSASMRPPTPSTSVSLPYSRGSGSSGPLRPPSRASSGALFTSSPGLPPPPPLLPPAHSAASEREGRRSVPGAENNSAAAGRSTPGGPSAPNSSSSSSGRTSQNQTTVPPLAFQFHQHNHQHQHTHTHQHFTPFLHPSATAPPLFEKFPSKMDGLYRHPFFPQYPPSSVSSIPPVIPPAGPFGSLQGAFQPKPLVPQGTAPDLTARLGVVSHHLQTKDHRLTDPFGTSLKISNKPGKWCAMHVHVAWMILSHQRKVKLMQADPHKLDFRSDLLSRFSGAVGLGGALPPTHDLTRPPSLFPAAGAVNPSSAPFISPSAPPSSFLPPAAHLDPYGRSPPFAPLGALGSGAFGGLGSPALAGSVFSPKEPPPSAVGGLPTSNHHIETWNRLHGGPSVFSGGPWIKEMDKRDERDRGKDMERRDIPHIKDEKDRDSLLYGRQPVRMSPVGPHFKPRSSTPVNHINGHSSALGGGGGPIEDLTRSLNRDRERERDGDKRPLPMMSSRAPPLGSSSLVADRDRPRSSSSSVLNTPPPSHRSIPSPMDLYPRSQAQPAHNLHNDHSQRDGSLPASSAASSSISSLSHVKKSDRTTTPVSKPSLSLPTVKVKEERKEEPEHIPITHPPPAPSHTFDRPNSHPHHPSSGTPSSCSMSLTPTPGVPLPPPTPNPPPHQPLMDRSRPFEAIMGSTAGLLVGSAGERFPHGPPPGQPQGPHSFIWDHWREIMAHQQHPHRREALALRSDPHLALRHDPHLVRLLQHQRHMVEAERAAVVAAAAAAGPPHPPTSTSAAIASGVRPEFSLIPFDRPPHLGPPGGGLLDEEQRAQILREDFERARYFAMHPHLPHGSHLSSPSHAAAAAAAAAHLEQLHPGLLPHSLPSGASPASQHHPSLYSRLGPINPHHMSNGILAKDLVGALSVGAPPPLIPSIASRSATPPRTSRLRGPSELALYSTHKDGESR
ncbi:PREDICTED: autism susceptibility gene 2 protein-like isoform X1 [Poecilia mexicana]|uniref:autism susceptibility gene 2 protein-like isoform X1 n=1 Tax=Poecilia mexicana TaxID=48701 RepID=UPI00072DD80A|nr:PREDICTED: autism susceptibility gene 2 protein-like isoform X1 [Poecilia mexicana]